MNKARNMRHGGQHMTNDYWRNSCMSQGTNAAGDWIVSYCGTGNGTCWCDDECTGYGDCCADICEFCGYDCGAFVPGNGPQANSRVYTIGKNEVLHVGNLDVEWPLWNGSQMPSLECQADPQGAGLNSISHFTITSETALEHLGSYVGWVVLEGNSGLASFGYVPPINSWQHNDAFSWTCTDTDGQVSNTGWTTIVIDPSIVTPDPVTFLDQIHDICSYNGQWNYGALAPYGPIDGIEDGITFNQIATTGGACTTFDNVFEPTFGGGYEYNTFIQNSEWCSHVSNYYDDWSQYSWSECRDDYHVWCFDRAIGPSGADGIPQVQFEPDQLISGEGIPCNYTYEGNYCGGAWNTFVSCNPLTYIESNIWNDGYDGVTANTPSGVKPTFSGTKDHMGGSNQTHRKRSHRRRKAVRKPRRGRSQ